MAIYDERAVIVSDVDGNNLVVTGAGAIKTDGSAATQPVSVASLPLPTGAATSALQTQPGVDIGDVTVNNAAGAAAVNIQDGGNSITVDGTVAISGSVAVTGPLTDTQLRASAVPVDVSDRAARLLGVLSTGANTIGKVDQGAPGATAWPSSNAAGSQVDGHSVTIGATTDADTALTVIGRLKKLVSLIAGGLPAALVGGRLDTNVGAWLGATTPTVGQKAAAASLPVVIATEQTGADNSTNSTSKVPTLGARANAAAPAWTEGNQVPLSTDLLGNLRAKLSGVVSTANASTALLGIAGVFTGTGEDVKDYAFISVEVFADQVSAAAGMSFQWSGDNTNWDVTNGTLVSASVGRAMTLTPRGRFFRIVYTNGGVAQGVFRLSTTFHATGTGIFPLPLNTVLTEENLAQNVRAFLAGKDASGNFQNLTSNPNKSLGVGDIGTRVTAGKYGAATGRIAGTVAAQNIATLANPAASGKVVYVRRITVACVSGGSAQTPYEYTLARTTAAVTAGGTVLISQKRDTADATAVGVARSGAVTATAAAGALWAGPGATAAATAVSHPMQLMAWDSKRDDDDIVLAAGEALLVSAEGNDTDLNHVVSFFWQEV